ncbi:MAG: sugar nucleotide-binding protein [Bacillota bacterium]|nr:sugar nucleotide-binding protein [Bacillota bacterium]
MRILLTGANGFLGRRIAAAANCVHAPSLREARKDEVKRLIDNSEPELIIHTAAISDIGECEKNPDASYRANVILPLSIAKAAKGVKTLMFSSDQVYTGSACEGPFREEDATSPANVYARHKLEMEERVLSLRPDTVMLRATWMYDLPLYRHDKTGNFLMQIIFAGLRQNAVSFSSQEFRGVTYAREVAELTLAAKDLPGGSYNFGSPTALSMFEIAKSAQKLLGIPENVMDRPKSRNLWMDDSKLRRQGLAFKNTLDGFRQCAKDYGLFKEP